MIAVGSKDGGIIANVENDDEMEGDFATASDPCVKISVMDGW